MRTAPCKGKEGGTVPEKKTKENKTPTLAYAAVPLKGYPKLGKKFKKRTPNLGKI